MTDDEDPAAWVEAFAEHNRYLGARVLPDGVRFAAVMPLLYTAAIVVGEVGDEDSILDRWCYASPRTAGFALELWDGTGEPLGWHRHPRSGRRVSIDPGERDEHGDAVGAVGVMYVRP